MRIAFARLALGRPLGTIRFDAALIVLHCIRTAKKYATADAEANASRHTFSLEMTPQRFSRTPEHAAE